MPVERMPKATIIIAMVFELRDFGWVKRTIPINVEIDPATQVAHQRSIHREARLGATQTVRTR